MALKKTLAMLFMSGSLLLSLPGCWDMVDIEKDGFILTVGIDAPGEERYPGIVRSENPPLSPPPKIQVSYEVYSPVLDKQNKARTTIVVKDNVATEAEAIKLLQGQYTRKLSLVHLRALAIGEAFAREGIKDLVECVHRCPRLADRFRITFIKDSRASEVLDIELFSERNVADVIAKMGERDAAYAFHRTLDFNDFHELMINTGGTAYVSAHELNKEKWLAKYGAAVLKDWKLIGWLDAYQTRAANWVTGNVDQAAVVTTLGDMSPTYIVTKVKSKITPQLRGSEISFKVQIATNGYLSEIANEPPQGIDHQLLQEIEKAMTEKIKAEAEAAIKKAKEEFAADYLTFGLAVENKYPAQYKPEEWNNTFLKAKIDVEVVANIRRIGTKR